MKKFLAIALSAILSVTLVACAAPAPSAEPTPTATPTVSPTPVADPTTATEPTTRIVKTIKGDIEIPAEPTKIVTDYYLGEFIALDVKPIIASPYALSNPFLETYVKDIASLDVTNSETALEMITAAEPDLIVTLSEADYEKFSQIAPTVLIPYGSYTPTELFLYIGDMLGKKDLAQQYIDDFNNKALAVKDEINSIVGDKTVSLVEIWPNEIYTMGSRFGRGGSILFDIWGLKAPATVQTTMVDGATDYEVVSLEVLPEYTGDFIFYGVLAGADSAFVETSNVWQNLPAVKAGHTMPYEQVAFMHSDPVSLHRQLDAYITYFRSVA